MRTLTRRRLFGLVPLPLMAVLPVKADAPSRFTPDGQPVPIEVHSVRIRPEGPIVDTAIFRRWRKEDIPLCRLCPAGSCCAKGDSCLIALRGIDVPSDQVALYSAVDLPVLS